MKSYQNMYCWLMCMSAKNKKKKNISASSVRLYVQGEKLTWIDYLNLLKGQQDESESNAYDCNYKNSYINI